MIDIDPAKIDSIELNQVLGATPVSANATRFCVWAPQLDRLEIKDTANDRVYSLRKFDSGYHVGVIEGLAVGDRYFVQIPGGAARPDPASRYQPDGVHGPSQIVDRHFAWTDSDWKGVQRDDLIIYELHIGAFTNCGTFESAIERLSELVELGINAIEIMPPNETAGRWNWGYDGVNLFAPRRSYGTPHDFRRFVDAAHAIGLAVIVDVVYNHFGPEGNYLGEFGSYISTKHNTVWGAAPNLDGSHDAREMRRFLIANAIHWLDEYHVDGLRVDAIHCIRDESEPHWVAELSDSVRRWGKSRSRQLQGRQPLLIAEANVYDPEMMVPRAVGGYDFDASWCDCFLHSVFGVVRPGEQLSSRVYDQSDLSRVLAQGFVFDGTIRRERERRNSSQRVETHGLVYSIQNHDFIGNHPLGRRLHQLTSIATQRAAAALLILSPAIPMLFMGEEFCCDHPFQFFVDFGDAGLRRGVVEGRRREYPQHDWSGAVLPTDPEAFYQSRIGSIADGDTETWTWYQSLISLRKRLRKLGLLDDERMTTKSDSETGLYLIEYSSGTSCVTVAVRLAAIGDSNRVLELPKIRGQLILDSLSPTRPVQPSNSVLAPNQAKIFLETAGR
jgi:maltooligosyltrehalose trehalohydrolase